MTIKTATCYFVVCDGCSDEEFGGEYTHHWSTDGDAVDHAESYDVFSTADGKHYCENCIEHGRAPADVLEAVKVRRPEEERAQ